VIAWVVIVGFYGIIRLMLKNLLLLTLLSLFFHFNAFAIRHSPQTTDQDLIELGKRFPTVGIVHHYKVDQKDDFEFDLPSTGTLIKLPDRPDLDGKVVLVATHGLAGWNERKKATFELKNGDSIEKVNVIDFSPAPSIISEDWLGCLGIMDWMPCLLTKEIKRDFGFAILERPIKGVEPSPIFLDSMNILKSDKELTQVGYGLAGPMDVGVAFSDSQRRAFQSKSNEYEPFVTLEDQLIRVSTHCPMGKYEKHDNLVRGAGENMDSGGPAFVSHNGIPHVLMIYKASIMTGQLDHMSLPEAHSFMPQHKETIEMLNGNKNLVPEKLNPQPNNNYSATHQGSILEYLPSSSGWVHEFSAGYQYPSHY
jgi:hypothetical protein